ncbi:MAG: hypothetical protein HEEMFOPI_01742 [Holosporales bacterium]
MKKIFCLLFILMCKLSFAAAFSEDQHLFQIGFEFQECHHICPWAIGEQEIQSTPIFSVALGQRVLWDLTIDWQDLEFVTKPVTNNELNILKIIMTSIQIACDVLVDLNEKASSSADVTFSKWIKAFQKKLTNNTDKSISCLIINTYSFNEFFFGSFKFPVYPQKRFSFMFQPQVTIHHHLEDSITLCTGLFVEGIKYGKNKGHIDIEKSNAKYLNSFIKMAHSLFIPEDQKTFCFPKKSASEIGFIFLHMMTCIDLSHEKKPREVDCGGLDFKTATGQTKDMCLLHFGGGQVNAKSSVNFMSRRPFSLMWKTISQGRCYEDVLKISVSELFLDPLKSKFDQMNYGEIFFTDDGKRMDLTQCLFSSSPVLKDPNIQFLLQNGILSLEFIRKLRVCFLENYFDEIIKSISIQTSRKRCVFDKKTKVLKHEKVEYDLLSPPYLISETDSMGAFKDDSKHKTEYGEAIIEFRMIGNIPESTLTRINDDASPYSQKIKGKFLGGDLSEICRIDFSLQTQVIGLFSYLEKLIKGEICDE